MVDNDYICMIDNSNYNIYCDKSYCPINQFKKNDFEIYLINSNFIELTNKTQIKRFYTSNDNMFLIYNFLIEYIKSKDEIIRNKYRY